MPVYLIQHHPAPTGRGGREIRLLISCFNSRRRDYPLAPSANDGIFIYIFCVLPQYMQTPSPLMLRMMRIGQKTNMDYQFKPRLNLLEPNADSTMEDDMSGFG